MAGSMDTEGKASQVINPWINPKLTLGEAMDIRIKEARQLVEKLCIQKAKLEAIDWLNLPYQDTRNLVNMDGFPY